jgi:hypothetical protein
MDREMKTQQIKSLPKPVTSTESNRHVVPRQSNSIAAPPGSRPLPEGSRFGRQSPPSNYSSHAADSKTVQLAAPNNDLQPSPERSSATHVSSPKTLAGSSSQHFNSRLLQHGPHEFRSGTLAIKSTAAPLSTQSTVTMHDAGHVPPAKSPTPLPLQLNRADLRATWINDSGSDTPLASTVASRTTRHPTHDANSKQRDYRTDVASSNRAQRLDHSQSLSCSGIQSGQLDLETMRMSLDSHDKSRRILQISSGSLIHATMHGFLNRVDLSPLRFWKLSCALNEIGLTVGS